MQVFEHGQMRVYLLSLLEQGPRHGYDIIKALENRFQGLYAPSAGTVYPRLSKLEDEGLLERTEQGRKALYRITQAGRAEVTRRAEEIAELNTSLDAAAQRLAQDARYRIRTGAADLRTQLAAAAQAARTQAAESQPAESQPAESQPAESQPTEPQTAEAQAGESQSSAPRRDVDDVWARVTDSVSGSFAGARAGGNPLGDVEGLLRAFGGGRFPDADMVAQALRRMGMARASGQPSPPTDASTPQTTPRTEETLVQPDAAPGTDATEPEVVDAEVVEDQAGEAEVVDAEVVDAEAVEAEAVEAEAVEAETTEEPPLHNAPKGEGSRHDGFPTPGQVREIVEILKEAGTRIQAVLKEPRA